MPIFRKATEQEIEEIARIEAKVFSDAWSSKSILETFRQTQAMVAVAVEEKTVIGYCILYIALDEGEIARIAIEPEWRKQGVGQGLLDHICEHCKKCGVERLLLDVREGNESARRFYEKYGFEVDGIRKSFYENPKENAVLMSGNVDRLSH